MWTGFLDFPVHIDMDIESPQVALSLKWKAPTRPPGHGSRTCFGSPVLCNTH